MGNHNLLTARPQKKFMIQDIMERFRHLSPEFLRLLIFIEKTKIIGAAACLRETGLKISEAKHLLSLETNFEYTLLKGQNGYCLRSSDYIKKHETQIFGFLPCMRPANKWQRCNGQGCYLKSKCESYQNCVKKYNRIEEEITCAA